MRAYALHSTGRLYIITQAVDQSSLLLVSREIYTTTTHYHKNNICRTIDSKIYSERDEEISIVRSEKEMKGDISVKKSECTLSSGDEALERVFWEIRRHSSVALHLDPSQAAEIEMAWAAGAAVPAAWTIDTR